MSVLELELALVLGLVLVLVLVLGLGLGPASGTESALLPFRPSPVLLPSAH